VDLLHAAESMTAPALAPAPGTDTGR